MTPIDLNHARKVADTLDRPDQHNDVCELVICPNAADKECTCGRTEAASLIRSLCERIEQLDSAIAAAGKEKAGDAATIPPG